MAKLIVELILGILVGICIFGIIDVETQIKKQNKTP